MAVSDINVCNMALSNIGTRSTIASLDEGSTEAISCAQWFERARDQTLSGAHWNFARRQIALATLNDATQGQTVPTPWLYEYAYPSDCIGARYIMPMVDTGSDAVPGSDTNSRSAAKFVGAPVRFLISSDVNANGNQIKVILTNQKQAILVYTTRITLLDLWDEQAIIALSYVLASRIAIQLTGDKTIAKSMFQIADEMLVRAQASNGNEGLSVHDVMPEWIRARGYASDWAAGSTFCSPQTLVPIT